jgi:hypothetical protein
VWKGFGGLNAIQKKFYGNGLSWSPKNTVDVGFLKID